MIQSGIFANQADLHRMRTNPNLVKCANITCNLLIINPFRDKYKLPQGSIGVDLRTGEFLFQNHMVVTK